MMRTLLTALLLVGPALVLPAHAANADVCFGQPATIVDLDGGTVQGTDGDDVIVTTPDVTVLAGAGSDDVCVTGTDDADYVDVQDAEALDIDLGGGYDTLHVSGGGAGSGPIDSGADGAYLEVAPAQSVVVDLADDLFSMDGNAAYELTGDWVVTASAKRVLLRGDDGPDHLRALDQSCKITIEGGPGKDWLAVAPNTIDLPPVACHTRRAPQLLGQGGNDLLVGWKRNDRLLGGPGRDTAKGGFGRDTCQAEVKKSCER